MPRITSISPGGRYVGIATLEGESLVRADLLLLRRQADQADKLSAFSERLAHVLVQDQPSVLVVEALRPVRDTDIARLQAERAGRVANGRGMELVLLDLRKAAQILIGDRRILALVPWVAERYPQTRSITANPRTEYRRARQLVAAVALGAAAARRLGGVEPGPEQLSTSSAVQAQLDLDLELEPAPPAHAHRPYAAQLEASA